MIAPHLDSSFCLESMFCNEVRSLVEFPVFTSKENFLNYLSNFGWKFEISVPDLELFVNTMLVNNQWVHGGDGGIGEDANKSPEDVGDKIFFRLRKIEKEVFKISEL